MIDLGLLGANGRMGQTIQGLIEKDYKDQYKLKALVNEGDSIEALLNCDLIIEFSQPKAVLSLMEIAHEKCPPLVIGCTGWSHEEEKLLNEFAKKNIVFRESNFSTGIMALHQILTLASPLLSKLGYEAQIKETHHVHKKDAPSGTAISLAETLKSNPDKVESVRRGEVIGIHEIQYSGPSDQISISHEAIDRSAFARGALEVGCWMVDHLNKIKKINRTLTRSDYMEDLKS